ncbi:MAG: hypothetical protein RLZZ308_214 [Candidatus Parcubacteria bacterium]|jgi:hypothetical protein
METIKISDLRVGPVRQEPLPEGFIKRVQKFKEILSEVETTSIEKTINSFQRDLHPERELLIWEKIASSYELNLKNNPSITLFQKKELFKKLLALSMGI